MNKTTRNIYWFTTVGTMGVLTVTLIMRNFFGNISPRQRLLLLSDGLALPGIFLLCVALLGWIARQGTFHMLTIAVQSFFSLWKRGSYDRPPTPSPPSSHRSSRICRPFLIVGGLCLILSGLFSWFWYAGG